MLHPSLNISHLLNVSLKDASIGTNRYTNGVFEFPCELSDAICTPYLVAFSPALYRVQICGAEGGNHLGGSWTGDGGKGGCVNAIFEVKQRHTAEVTIGQRGRNANTGLNVTGGWPNGGHGNLPFGGGGASGGGSSSIDLFLVAGAGGGGNNNASGGNGGYPNGGDGSSLNPGKGGTQFGGGEGCKRGLYLFGGPPEPSIRDAGGGGGGYFGGGRSCDGNSSGGGGSSHIERVQWARVLWRNFKGTRKGNGILQIEVLEHPTLKQSHRKRNAVRLMTMLAII